MGQYFKAVNTDKKEFVCPWCLNGGAKLWEWSANRQGSIFTILLRRSDCGGGGDFDSLPTQFLAIDDDPKSLASAVMAGIDREGRPVVLPEHSIVGRWAGDSVMLIGDYDSSGLYERARQFRNITEEVVTAWNAFIGSSDTNLDFEQCESCRDRE